MSILIKPAYDSDASAYFTTAGVTSTAGRQQVSRFVTGIKDLGLWNNMVCWPLRSSQNAGTGTTAYSLGGLGTFNGTLTNGPTWDSDGVIFDGSNDSIITGIVPISGSSPRTIFAVAKSSSGSLNSIFAIGDNNTQDQSWGILQFPNSTTLTGWGANRDSTIGTITSGVFSSSSFGYLSSRFGYINGVLQTLTGATQAPDTFSSSIVRIGNSFTNWYYNGTIAFACLFNTGSSITNIHSLYKSTLGQGLGLP